VTDGIRQPDSNERYGSGVTGRARAPKGYDPDDYPRVAVTVDIVVLTIVDRRLHVVLVERSGDPHAGSWALPGGFIHPDETLEQAADRELTEETGVRAAAYLEQFGAYGDPGRDPRMRVVSVAYLAVLREVGRMQAGSDAVGTELVPVSQVLGRRPKRELAFDHRQILQDGVEGARFKLEYTSLGTAFAGPTFTLSELRGVYEAAWNTDLDPGNFRRKVLSTEGFVEPTGDWAAPGPEGGKPAQVYRAGRTKRLHPPMSRPPG
jgi:8-oxo-dGTP diphosphatase